MLDREMIVALVIALVFGVWGMTTMNQLYFARGMQHAVHATPEWAAITVGWAFMGLISGGAALGLVHQLRPLVSR